MLAIYRNARFCSVTRLLILDLFTPVFQIRIHRGPAGTNLDVEDSIPMLIAIFMEIGLFAPSV